MFLTFIILHPPLASRQAINFAKFALLLMFLIFIFHIDLEIYINLPESSKAAGLRRLS